MEKRKFVVWTQLTAEVVKGAVSFSPPAFR